MFLLGMSFFNVWSGGGNLVGGPAQLLLLLM
jgi:hypothetical protein